MIKCPKCQSEVLDDCCIKCGYMINGNMVKLEEAPDKNLDLKLFDKDFDKICRNENYYIPLIMGPLYFLYRSNFWLGFLFVIADFFLLIFVFYIISYLKMLAHFLLMLYIVINRIMYAAFANELCIFIDKIKIKKIKKKYGQKYREKLLSHHNRIFFVILTLEIYILLFILMINN